MVAGTRTLAFRPRSSSRSSLCRQRLQGRWTLPSTEPGDRTAIALLLILVVLIVGRSSRMSAR
jgi:hypothetical protein